MIVYELNKWIFPDIFHQNKLVQADNLKLNRTIYPFDCLLWNFNGIKFNGKIQNDRNVNPIA